MESIEQRFIRYVKIDTESDENSSTYPSTKKQLILANLLCKELQEMEYTSTVDEYGLVYAKIPGNPELKKIGLIAHMDTAPTIEGGNFEPRIIRNFDGNDVKLNKNYTLSHHQFPHLPSLKGKTIIVTDGDHLLGGDDKAGVAIIMDIASYFHDHPEIDHAPISICFTPDEEIGAGADHFDVKKMDADIAYTLDGGEVNEINYENFNASTIKVTIKGVGIHPGSAKDIMVNAVLLGMEFNKQLDQNAIPGKTEGYEGFIHLEEIKGDVENCTLSYILRDHDLTKLKEKEVSLVKAKEYIQSKYPTCEIDLLIKEQYRNMRTYFDQDFTAITMIEKAYKKAQVPYKFSPIRGGTDGARITFMGLPCPNLGVGDYCCHGRYEHVVVEEMKQAVEVIKALTIC